MQFQYDLPVPKFEHDCTKCIFLGTFNGQDLYFHNQFNSLPTVIARYGDNGPDYISGLSFSRPGIDILTNKPTVVMELYVARMIAELQGLLPVP